MHNTVSCDYRETDLRSYLNGKFKQAIPDGIKSEIKPVIKRTNVPNVDRNVTSTEYVWLPSYHELDYSGTAQDYSETEGAYYPDFGTSSSAKLRYKRYGNTWFRSGCLYGTSIKFIAQNGNAGGISQENARAYNYLMPGFCT